MTTPSINVDILLESGTGQRFNTVGNCNGVETFISNQPNRQWKRLTEVRPASTNHPKNRATGWRIPGAWSHTKLEDNPSPFGTAKYWTTLPSGACPAGAWYRYTGGYDWLLSRSALPAVPSSLEGRAVTKALLKLKNQNVNLSVAFAERQQTIDMFKKHARTIATQVRSYKRRYPVKWKKVLHGNARDTPNDWLELQYGWKPLISDIDGSCRELSKHEDGNDSYLAKVKGSAAFADSGTWNKITNTSSLIYMTVTEKRKYLASVSLYYKMRNPVLAKFASLGLTNPFELAWEKLKYSFVIDWFLPVGKWLSTLDADFGWDFHSGTLTKFATLSADSRFIGNQSLPSIKKVDWSGTTYSAKGINMTRTVYASAPWGGIPRFKNPLSGLHVANAVALLVQAFRR